jgi:hypothetical protein
MLLFNPVGSTMDECFPNGIWGAYSIERQDQLFVCDDAFCDENLHSIK